MFAFRSVLSGARSLALMNRTVAVAAQGQQRFLSTVGLRCAGRSNLSQVSASSRFLMNNLSRGSIFLSQKRSMQTQQTLTGDLEMSEFLEKEIEEEKKSLKATGKAVQVKGFEVETNDAEVTFKKDWGTGEKIKVVVNVNHSVESENDDFDEQKPEGEEPSMAKMVCKPNFHVEIVKNGHTLGFNCVISRDEDADIEQGSDAEPYHDEFNIEEFSIFKGEFKDTTYIMSGEIMDASFYDNLMNMLDERGINSDFVHQVTDFCTLYEQKLYVNLLEHLADIVKTK